nr:hypothetical protein [uncultured Rhodoferax sp.]
MMVLSFTFAAVPLYGLHAGMPLADVLILALFWSTTAALLVYYWRNMPQGRLSWDGESWHWSGVAEPLKAVAIQYDFQSSLWLLLTPAAGRPFGVWMDADPRKMAQWRAMRRALVGAGSFHWGADNPLNSDGKR